MVKVKERVERDEEDLVRLYLTDIGQYPLLTKDDEVRLAQQIEAGSAARSDLKEATPGSLTDHRRRDLRRKDRLGLEAERTFVQSNLRLVVSIAKKYQASGLPLLDLIQEGNLGLMHAVEKFDWRKGFKFSTYATWWIRQAITRGIANTGRTIRLPVHAGDTLARLQKARSRLELKYGRPPTLSEMAGEVEMPEEKITEALRFQSEPLSLSEPLRQDGDAELGDVVEDRSIDSPFDTAATTMLPNEIMRLLSPLDERERDILKLRFGLDRGEPRTLEEVGEHFNLTRERIRQIEARAMSKLRHPSSDTGARDPSQRLRADAPPRPLMLRDAAGAGCDVSAAVAQWGGGPLHPPQIAGRADDGVGEGAACHLAGFLECRHVQCLRVASGCLACLLDGVFGRHDVEESRLHGLGGRIHLGGEAGPCHVSGRQPASSERDRQVRHFHAEGHIVHADLVVADGADAVVAGQQADGGGAEGRAGACGHHGAGELHESQNQLGGAVEQIASGCSAACEDLLVEPGGVVAVTACDN